MDLSECDGEGKLEGRVRCEGGMDGWVRGLTFSIPLYGVYNLSSNALGNVTGSPLSGILSFVPLCVASHVIHGQGCHGASA